MSCWKTTVLWHVGFTTAAREPPLSMPISLPGGEPVAREELLQQIPPIARYRREPLDDRQNALFFWTGAAEKMVELDDSRLYEELVYGNPEAGDLTPFPSGSDADRVRRLLRDNSRTLDLLRVGTDCGRLQFPEPEEEADSDEDSQSLVPLVHLANTWFILARSLIADNELAGAATELSSLGQMCQMICCGEGLVVHYLVGCSIMSMGLAGIRLLLSGGEVPGSVLADLSATIDGWLKGSGGVAQCLRVDLCCHSLGEIDRLSESEGLENMVDELLDRHYVNAPVFPWEGVAVDELFEDDGRLAWRREKTLYLLQGHAAPFDKIATVRLMGRTVADRILDLQPPRRLNVLGPWARLIRSYRRHRFRYRSHLWPAHLRSSFPYEYLGGSEVVQRRRAELRGHVAPDQWAKMQPPTDAELEVARRRLRFESNPFGVLAADALLDTDITRIETMRRRRMHATQAAIADAMRG